MTVRQKAAAWRKSSRSNLQTNCVEVALTDAEVAVRDSKNPNGPVLAVSAAGWAQFQQGVKAGLFDLI